MLVAVCALARSAGASPKDSAVHAFGGVLDAAESGSVEVRVPLVRRDGASVVSANHAELGARGLVSTTDGPDDEVFHREVLDRYALRRATPAEIDAGLVTHYGIATRYHDRNDGRSPKAVLGDGRVVIVGDVAILDARTDRVIGTYEVQIKGVDTGLRVAGVDTLDRHGTGRAEITSALHDGIMAEYLHANGVATDRLLAVIDTGETFDRRANDGSVEHLHGVIAVRGGNFLRLAHLRFFREDPHAMRALLTHANREISGAMGRSTPLPWAMLYCALVTQKAEELASTYWSRAMHGSITYDNTALLMAVDHSTGTVVDRPHARYAPNPRTSTGFAREAGYILQKYYAADLPGMMRDAAPTEADRVAIGQLDPERVAESALQRAMAAGALEHLGLDADEVGAVLHQAGPAAYHFAATARAVGEQAAAGAEHWMGGTEGGTLIHDPSRFDLFGALAETVDAYASGDARTARIQRLVPHLHPLGATDRAAVEQAAGALLDAVEPVMASVLAGLDGPVREARLALITDQARRINRPVREMVQDNVHGIIRKELAARAAGGDPLHLQARLHGVVRDNVRRGPGTAAAAAQRIRWREMGAPDAAGRFEISSSVDNGVRIAERSDGVQDTVRVTLAGDPLHAGDPSGYRMRYTLGDGAWHEAGTSGVDGQRAVFEIALDGRRPDRFEAGFRHPDATRAWDNAGLQFVHHMAVASDSVDAELSAVADDRGQVRASTPPAARAAVRAVAARARTLGRPTARFRVRPTPAGIAGRRTR